MRMTYLGFPLAVLLAGCALLPLPTRTTPAASGEPDVARTEPREGEDPATKIFDEATRQAALAKRFPGSDRIDVVRMLYWTADRVGACWSELPPPWETKIDARYSDAGQWGEKTASGIKELRDQGWLGLYRSPNGSGFERRARFRSLDIKVASTLRCRCSIGSVGSIEEETLPFQMRFRWQGKGKMPEVSAAIEKNGKLEGLPVALAPGHLMSYEFAVNSKFPAGRAGKCGTTLTLALLSDPAMQ